MEIILVFMLMTKKSISMIKAFDSSKIKKYTLENKVYFSTIN